jgi:hypothetical protein
VLIKRYKSFCPLFIIFSLLISGCGSTLMGIYMEGDNPPNSHPPIIEDSFAQKVIRPGSPWKVYIRASDPDGDMSLFILDFQRPGWPTTPYYLGIKKDYGREISGYLLLHTSNIRDLDELISLNATLTLIIQDRKGNTSAPVRFPLSFNYMARTEEPEGGSFEDHFIGIIPVIELWHDVGPSNIYPY